MTKRRVMASVLLSLSMPAIIWAGCLSDCKDEYDSAVASCKMLYDEPHDADDLKVCIQSAKDEYKSCIDECTE